MSSTFMFALNYPGPQKNVKVYFILKPQVFQPFSPNLWHIFKKNVFNLRGRYLTKKFYFSETTILKDDIDISKLVIV